MTAEFIYVSWWLFYLQFQIVDALVYASCFGQTPQSGIVLTTQYIFDRNHIYLSMPGWIALLVGAIIDAQILLLFAAILDVAVKKRIDNFDTIK